MSNNSMSQQGSLAGATLLITGCCIGAGMLGLPVLSAQTGFGPSIVLFFLSWLFMAGTGLLMLEVNLWFKEDVSIVTMAEKTLGLPGKVIAWSGFLFLFYALMVAYIGGCGDLIADFYHDFTNTLIPSYIGSVLVAILFGIMIYLGTKAVDWFNRVFMVGLVISYALMVYLGASHVDVENLKHHDWSAAYLVIPTLIISYGYHNLIPTLSTYLGHDYKRLRIAILVGSILPFVVYVLWEWLILGLVPLEGDSGFRQALAQGDMATRALRAAVGNAWVVDVAQYFAFFAVVTSFLAVSLSFVDFLADGLHIKKDRDGKLILCLAVIAIPLFFSMVYPKIFLSALNYAGSFGAVTLFGLLPVAMVWKGRYTKKMESPEMVPGGKVVLIALLLVALAIMGLQLYQDLSKAVGL